jgi:hypothetical protein
MCVFFSFLLNNANAGNLNPADNLGRGEVHLAEAATHLIDYLQEYNKNNTLVFVYRQIQVSLYVLFYFTFSRVSLSFAFSMHCFLYLSFSQFVF